MMLDPLILRGLALAYGLLFTLSALHKLGDTQRFRFILSDYRILPEPVLGTASRLLPVLECLLGIGWLAVAVLLSAPALLVVSSALLLIVYAGAIAMNLQRGRAYIDCGCQFGRSARSLTGTALPQQLTWWLVARNLLLTALMLTVLTGTTGRQIGLIDHLTLAPALLVLVLMYAAFNQLSSNQGAIASWRTPHA